ncbi:MAG: DNA polymerase III subunit gamma/tau [Clostridia bacterium]|nr:DNA polymerase III subunit gamma/tau [Clostridia bacterium]
MAYIALYRKWRPALFEDVVEQEHVVRTLKNSVTSERIAHAYLFCGTRGTGKTTTAHIFSRAINCLNPNDGDPCNQCEVCRDILSGSILDVIEIDAASNNSVDNVREIRDEVVYAPSRAKFKVYIIDEVHMLSSGAFNALLKTLEEPPPHVVFILATTEPHKLPPTILSRCQRFDFRRITVDSIAKRLDMISGSNGVVLSQEAARLIARLSDGALRDAISILDQCIATGKDEISYEDVLSVVGIVKDTFISDMVSAIADNDIGRILKMVDMLVMDGKDITQFVSDMVLYYRNLLICKISLKPEEIIEASKETIELMKELGGRFSQESIMSIIKELSAIESSLKWATHPRVLLEMVLVKICESEANVSFEGILARLAELERKISSGEFAVKQDVNHTAKKETLPKKETPSSQEDQAPHKEKKGKSNLANVKSIEQWAEVLNDLKGNGRMALYTSLMDAKAVQLDHKFIGIIFKGGSSFNKMMVCKIENMEALESAASRVLGREVKFKCLDEDSFEDGAVGGKAAEKDELLEKAQDIAKRLNTPLNIIDE